MARWCSPIAALLVLVLSSLLCCLGSQHLQHSAVDVHPQTCQGDIDTVLGPLKRVLEERPGEKQAILEQLRAKLGEELGMGLEDLQLLQESVAETHTHTSGSRSHTSRASVSGECVTIELGKPTMYVKNACVTTRDVKVECMGQEGQCVVEAGQVTECGECGPPKLITDTLKSFSAT